MGDKTELDPCETSQEQDTVSSTMQSLEWLAGVHMARTIGDNPGKQSIFTSCLVNDAMYLKDKYTEEEEECTEAAISAVCQSIAFLFSQVASGVLTKDQLRVKIEEFITR